MAAFLDACRFNPTAGGTTDWTYSSPVPGYLSPAAAGAVNGRLYKYRAESGDLSQWELGEGAYNSGASSFARTAVLFNSSGTTSKINFSTVPQVAVVALKEDLISIEEVNSFTDTQRAQVRSNIYAAPFDALAFGGMQTNGGVDVSQDLGTTVATLAISVAKHIADCIQSQYVNSTAVVTSAQLAAASFPAVLSGYSNALQIKATTKFPAQASLSNGDYCLHRWLIEGYRIARLGFGASGAQSFSYGVQYYATNAGTIFLKFSNSNYSRCYYQEQTIAAGWNWLTGTIAGDTSGTWAATTGVGLYVEIFSVGKAASPVAPGSWGATNTTQTTNSASVLGTTNNDQVCATGLIMVPGTEVPASARAPFIMRPYDQEFTLCRRYLHVLNGFVGGQVFAAGMSYTATYALAAITFPFPMRASPTFSINSDANIQVRNMYGAFAGVAATTFTGTNISGRLEVTTAGGSQTAGQAVLIEAANTSLKLTWDARLA